MREIKLTFYLPPNVQERLIKKIKFKMEMESGEKGDFLIVAPKVFCGNFFIDDIHLDGSQFSIQSTGLCLVQDYQRIGSCLYKERPDFFFIDTKYPSKTFKIRYNWIEPILVRSR